jgi:protocatechuate 3,4-dioxygenase beta subunit
MVPFNEDNASEIVADRLGRDGSRLAATLALFVRHLHGAVREARPTPADWRQAIRFLTEVGHASDDRRQEWILLSDLLGVTALVEEINAHRPKGATPNTPRGPFYRAAAPRYAAGASISLDGIGEPLAVKGRVSDLDGEPIVGATVETWQANGEGQYENQQPDRQPDFNLRGIFLTDDGGRFHYRSVKPAGYAVPSDGPVGQLLQSLGYPLRRPAHLQFMISAPGFDPVTTHVYDRSDPHVADDAVLGVRDELLGDFHAHRGTDGNRAWSLDFTFVMARSRNGRRAA